MAYPVTLSAAAALSIAGAAMGIQLGRGTIAEIDPLYFSDAPPERFYADLVPGGYRTSDPQTAHPDDFWAGNMNASGRPECFDCVTTSNSGGHGFAPDDRSQDAYVSEAALPEPVEQRTYAPVERYANFPVTQEEAERQSRDARRPQQSADYALEAHPAPAEPAQPDASPVGM